MLSHRIERSYPSIPLVLLLVVAAQGAPPDGPLLQTVEQQYRLIAEKVRAEVDNEVRQARAQMAGDPAGVEQNLKLLLERVLRTPQLSAELRATLRGQLESAVREANRRSAIKDVSDRQIAAARAASADRRRVADSMERGQERARQLIERFGSLMDEGRYAESEAMATGSMQDLAADLPVAATAALLARQRGAAVANLAQRNARQMKVVATLAPVEAALVPSPDDEPFVYPAAGVWQELTLRRTNRYRADLSSRSPAEAKIERELAEPTTLDFTETPLAGVVEYLKDLHGIEIQLDTRALEEVGVLAETPVTATINGVSLRSALRLLLRRMDLTYVVKDEAIVVTTTEQAAHELVTRAYPVADLPGRADRQQNVGARAGRFRQQSQRHQ